MIDFKCCRACGSAEETSSDTCPGCGTAYALADSLEHAKKLDALLVLFNEKEQAAIAELARLYDVNELVVVRQALRYYQLAISLNVTLPNDSPGCGVIE